MSESEAESGSEVFDVERIRKLISLMDDHELSEIDLRHADQRIRLRKGSDAPEITYAPIPQHVAPAAAAQPAQAAAAPAAPVEEVDGDNIVIIRSPMVGTFYSRPNPNAESFVRVGDSIDTETTVCIIEAMKVFNDIPAEVRGKIISVLVDDEEHVDHNKPLFKVDTNG